MKNYKDKSSYNVKPDSTADIQKMMDKMPRNMDMSQKEHKLY